MKNHFKVVCDDCKEVITTKDYLCIIDNQTKIVKYNSHIEMEDCPKFKKNEKVAINDASLSGIGGIFYADVPIYFTK